MKDEVWLRRDTNQALGLGQFAVDFLRGACESGPSTEVLRRTQKFHTDALLCGISALALKTNAPSILRAEALEYPDPQGATVFGSVQKVKSEKAVLANSSAVREWDSNGTNFGYNPERGFIAGEFGHNDFYAAAIAACQSRGFDGLTALCAMVLIDEIRGRLAEVFSLKSYKIDHVVHGGIAVATVFTALSGGTPEQVESAIGQFVAHAIPWRAIRAGKQLSDSKGASAAISAEIAVIGAKRALAGFVGPKDIFRNPESIFRQFEPTEGDSPFDLVLRQRGDDFAVMGMHFKLGLYEHQSAGAIQGLIDLLARYPQLAQDHSVQRIVIKAYEPAFSIIGDPAKRDPQTRQSADHSMVYIVARVLAKAQRMPNLPSTNEALWKALMLSPLDYSPAALHDPQTRHFMAKIAFEHGGADYDVRYPDGIPTSVSITDHEDKTFDSGLVMYPAGHARNTSADLDRLLKFKWDLLAKLAFPEDFDANSQVEKFESIATLSAEELGQIYSFPIAEYPPLDSANLEYAN